MHTMMTKKINKSTKLQKGFSLIELSMVIAVIALLLIAAAFTFTSIKNNLDIQEATDTLRFHFLAAVKQCENRRGDLLGCNANTIIAVSPLTSTATPWGGRWQVAPSANALFILYPLAGAPEALSLAPNLAVQLDAISGVTARTGVAGGVPPITTLIVNYNR